MKNMDVLKLAQAALSFADAVKTRKQAETDLDHAYFVWKRDNNITEVIQRGDDDWEAMMLATKAEYLAVRRCRDRERRGRDKLVKLSGEVSA
jgi:hypothetical protein